jgi:hypothetical protein
LLALLGAHHILHVSRIRVNGVFYKTVVRLYSPQLLDDFWEQFERIWKGDVVAWLRICSVTNLGEMKTEHHSAEPLYQPELERSISGMQSLNVFIVVTSSVLSQ